MDDIFSQLLTNLVSTTVIVAIVTVVLGFFVNKKLADLRHDLGLEATTRELTLRSQIDFKERQLSEFYGPIYARLMRGNRLYELWRQGTLDRVEKEVLALFVQANEDNVQTILNKSDLIDGDEIPDSYIRYLVHVAVWDPFLKKTPVEIPPYEDEGFQDGQYPDDFEESIILTTEKLKREISELYEAYGFER
jgi:hypothetical protein